MNHKEIEQNFTSAGWELDGSFSDHLIIDYDGDGLSILAHREEWETDGLPSKSSITREYSPTGPRKFAPLSRLETYFKSMGRQPRGEAKKYTSSTSNRKP